MIPLVTVFLALPRAGWPPHPRLRLNATGVARTRAAIGADPRSQQLWADLLVRSEQIMSDPMPSPASLLSSLQNDIYPLGLRYRLSTNTTERSRLAKRAAAELVAVTQLEAWSQKTEMGDVRFLTIAETMHGVAIGYDWFYHDLSATQRATIEDGLFRCGLGAALTCYSYNCTW